MIKNKLKKQLRTKKIFIPIIHRGRIHWLSNVILEKAFNDYRMMIINIQKA